ncbi:MAG: nitroreductase [Solobacterium sp.]|nr:nitroreductase [Solobacterium sp.]
MNRYEMIFRRKSFHLFRNLPAMDLDQDTREEIVRQWDRLRPLNPHIRTGIRIVPSEESACRRGNTHTILFYSERKEDWLRNIGYLGMQLDLYLCEKNIGTLWYGIGKEESTFDGMTFVIMMGIRAVPSSAFRKDMFKSRRKPLAEIWQGSEIDGVSDIVRFAPSACNTQPWLVRYEDNTLTVYRYRREGKRGIMPKDRVIYYNRIDIGIFLCMLEILLAQKGISYTRECFCDTDDEGEYIRTAVYDLKVPER